MKPMKVQVVLPDTNLSLIEWLIKHQVSTSVCSMNEVCGRATDSQILQESYQTHYYEKLIYKI